MELNASKQSVRKILTNKNEYIVPRYQREYAWEKNEISEYFEDIIKQLSFSNGDVKSNDYFIGSILLTGDYNASGQKLEIVDGQQRLTTITIMLSALGSIFEKEGETELANIVWEYIIAKDDNGKEYSIIFNEMQYPYFQYYIQRRKKEDVTPKCEEEERIEAAYIYFKERLEKDILEKFVFKYHIEIDIKKYKYIDILKAVRDQVLNSYVVCIWTTEERYANEIFEILNAKGKKLASTDLIKNTIFKCLDVEIPDDVKLKWKQIKDNLSYPKGRIEFSTFFRHYWISKYTKVSEERLYDEFVKVIPNSKEEYQKFVSDMLKFSKIYIQIVFPRREDFDNRKEYFYLTESLKNLTETFGITQVRLALLSLFDAKFNKKIITAAQLKDIVLCLEKFHFAYNAICSTRSNKLEAIYSKFAIKINKAKDKTEATKEINELKKKIIDIRPSFEEFTSKFVMINFSKNPTRNNVIAKYIVNEIEKKSSRRDISAEDGTVEHIMAEDGNKPYSLNIGNLILVERIINEQAERLSISDKIKKYRESKYNEVENFIKENENITVWGEDQIKQRANKMAVFFYNKILNY